MVSRAAMLVGTQPPVVTRFFIGPWAPLALALAAFILVAGTTRLSAKWVPLVVAMVTTLFLPAIFLVAMDLPICAIAGQVQSA
jgi:hypothetical protein